MLGKEKKIIENAKLEAAILACGSLLIICWLYDSNLWLGLAAYFLILTAIKLVALWFKDNRKFYRVKFDQDFYQLATDLLQQGFELQAVGDNAYIFTTKNFVIPNVSCTVLSAIDGHCFVIGTAPVLSRLMKSIQGFSLVAKADK